MNREFLLNIILLVLINLLIKPLFIFGIDLGVQNQLGEQYGLYFALLNLTYLSQIINDFGIQNFNNRHISQHPYLLPKYFPNLLAIKGVLALFYVSVTLLIAWFWLGYEAAVIPLLLVLLFNQVLAQLILFLRTNISGLGHYRTDSLLSSLDKLLMLVTCGAIIWFHVVPLSLMSFALAQTLALACSVLVVLLVMRKLAAFDFHPSWVVKWREGRAAIYSIFKQSLPYALTILLMFAYSRMDGVLLERIAGAAHADVYASGYRLLDACNMFGYLFATLLLPMFARMLKRKDNLEPLINLSFNLIWAGSITLSAAVFFARKELLTWMMPLRISEYRFEVLGLLIWAFVPVSVIYIFSTLLTAGQRLMKMNRFFVLGIGLDLILNLILIPKWQATGSALAAISTQVFISGAIVWLAFREFKLTFYPARLAAVIGFALFVIFGDYVLFGQSGISIGIKLVGAMFFGAIGLLIFRLINIRNLRKALSY